MGSLRGFTTARGHGFVVLHEPVEGVHHAEIRYRPALDDWSALKKSDKAELRDKLADIFDTEVGHECLADCRPPSADA